MRTIDYMSDRDLRDLRDAGRGHLIDGSPLLEKADEMRKREREEPSELSGDQLEQSVADAAAKAEE